MPRSLKSTGKGATVFIQSNYAHPSEHIRAKVVNPDKGHKLQSCIFLRQEVKKISGKDQLVVVVTHPDFKSGDDMIELHSVKLWFVLDNESVVSGQVNVQMDEGVHVPRSHVRPKKDMVVRKRIPHGCLWFDAGVVPYRDRQSQGHANSTSAKRTFGLGENCQSTVAIDETIVAHCQDCYP